MAAMQAFRRVYSDPGGEQRKQAFDARQAVYGLRWAYYTNSAFDDLERWQVYRSTHRLYRMTRSIYNPTARLVDFYTGAVFPGRLSVEPGKPSAIPLGEDTPPALRTAIAEVYRASNWQANKSVMIRWGGALGETLIEIMDDVERGQVYLQNTWPGYVADLELDAMGNVKAYAIEYTAEDENEQPYRYRKEVDKLIFTEYRNEVVMRTWPNPYGFVPACWCVHRNEGGDHGAPAIRNVGKIDELNSLAAHVLDELHKRMSAPVLFAGQTSIAGGQAKRPPSDQAAQEAIPVVTGSQDASIHAVDIPDMAGPMASLERIIAEVEADHPELTFYQQLRDMQQVTGPGAARLMGDVEALVGDAQANYDEQMRKALQMAVAIGGWRLSQGDWGSPNRQQAAYQGFDLDSYDRGDLDFEIDARPLIPLTKLEQLEIERQELALQNDRAGGMTENRPAAIADRLRMAAGG